MWRLSPRATPFSASPAQPHPSLPSPPGRPCRRRLPSHPRAGATPAGPARPTATAAPSPTAPPPAHPVAPRPPEGRRRPFPRLAPSRPPPPFARGTPAPAARGERPSRAVSTRSLTRRGARRRSGPPPRCPALIGSRGSSVKAVLPAEGNAGDSSAGGRSAAEAEGQASLHGCPGLSRSFTSGEKLQKEAPEGRICSGLGHRKGRNRGWRGKSIIFVFLGEGLATFTVAVEAQKPGQEKARLSPGRFKLCQLAAVQSRAGTDFCWFVA